MHKTVQASEIVIKYFEPANWHTLNERVKNQDLSGIELWASRMSDENVILHKLQFTLGKMVVLSFVFIPDDPWNKN